MLLCSCGVSVMIDRKRVFHVIGSLPELVMTLLQLEGLGWTWMELKWKYRSDGLVPDRSNSSALAMELLQSCTKPSRCYIQENIFENVVLLLTLKGKHVSRCTRKCPLAANIVPWYTVFFFWFCLNFMSKFIIIALGLFICWLCFAGNIQYKWPEATMWFMSNTEYGIKHHVNSFLTMLQGYSITIPLQQHLSNISVIFNRCVLKPKKCMKNRKIKEWGKLA